MMRTIMLESIQNISSLRHFYDIQKQYIDKKAKEGMKKHNIGYLMNFYFYMLLHGSEEEQKNKTFVNLKQLLEKYIEIENINSEGVIYRVKNSNSEEAKRFNIDIGKAAKEYRRYSEMPEIHGSNTIVMIITRFEEFISDYARLIYKKYPEKYLDGQTVSFSEISKADIESIKSRIVDREIEKLMRDSYTEWFKIFKSHGMKFDNCAEEYEKLRELYARRNIIVHNSGVVNDAYIKSIPNTTYTCGDKVPVDDTYINNAFVTIKTIMLCIMLECIRVENDNQEGCIATVFDATFEELLAENYETCKTVFYSLSNSPFSDSYYKNLSLVNYWISIIEMDGLDSIKEEIKKFDVSSLDKKFSVAKEVLLGKYDTATELVKELCDKKELSFQTIDKWPLFKKYRTSDEYKNFKMLHPELEEHISIEANKEDSMMKSEAKEKVRKELKNAQVEKK